NLLIFRQRVHLVEVGRIDGLFCQGNTGKRADTYEACTSHGQGAGTAGGSGTANRGHHAFASSKSVNEWPEQNNDEEDSHADQSGHEQCLAVVPTETFF